LNIAGDGSREEVEKAKALAEGIQNVRFLGWLDFDRKAAILSASSIFVLPSADENFAVAAAEAMAAGVPVIATKNVGILTFLEGRRAVMVVEESADAIAKAIDDLAFDEQKRNAQSEAARSAANELFRWSKISKTVRQLYDDILNS
jgi:glycosyltransferase involved in cell wall biosynthesis